MFRKLPLTQSSIISVRDPSAYDIHIFYVYIHRFLKNVSILLFLNKIDILAEKVNKGRSIKDFADKYSDKLPDFEKYTPSSKYICRINLSGKGLSRHRSASASPLSSFATCLDKRDFQGVFTTAVSQISLTLFICTKTKLTLLVLFQHFANKLVRFQYFVSSFEK